MISATFFAFFFGCYPHPFRGVETDKIINSEVIYEQATIAYNAFQNCTSLDGVVLPETLTSIGREAFSGCTSFTEINLPNSVTSIYSYAFDGCNGITELELPNELERDFYRG